MIKILLTFLTISIGYTEDFYVKSLKAPLLELPDSKAKIKTAIDRGSLVRSLKTEGLFIKVNFNNQEGFINKMFLSSTPIQNKNSLLQENVDISSKARKRASGFTSAAAARGLKEDSNDIFDKLENADLDQIKKMETLLINDRVGFRFLMNPNLKIEEVKK